MPVSQAQNDGIPDIFREKIRRGQGKGKRRTQGWPAQPDDKNRTKGVWRQEDDKKRRTRKGQEENKSRTRGGQEKDKRRTREGQEEEKRRTKGSQRTTTGLEKDKGCIVAGSRLFTASGLWNGFLRKNSTQPLQSPKCQGKDAWPVTPVFTP